MANYQNCVCNNKQAVSSRAPVTQSRDVSNSMFNPMFRTTSPKKVLCETLPMFGKEKKTTQELCD